MITLSNWKLQSFDPGRENPLTIAAVSYIDHFWMTAKVPGDVHSTLIEHKLIEDPFIGHNDLKCRWIEEKEWWYRTVFNWNLDHQDQEIIELNFQGLDTYATIYLNGKEIGSTENMFIEHTFDITRELEDGKNVIAVRFDPLSKHVGLKEKDYWCSYGKERLWARKSSMNFGWDWGPRLVTAGIWKEVNIVKKSKTRLGDIFVHTASLSEEEADLHIDLNLKRHFLNKDALTALVTLSDGDAVVKEEVKIHQSKTEIRLTVNNPKLWWTHDLGDSFLYDCTVSLKDQNGIELDTYTQKVGIRTINVDMKHENGENLFTFNLNGIRLFAKGSNWIPVHNFLGAVDNDRYKKLLYLAKESNMNMIRVWGGGIYEKDVFYEECDRLGLLVWQDFMFANALYPDYNKDFMKTVEEEIEAVVKKLRKHPSLALWCGNNEIDWIYDMKFSSGLVTTPFYGRNIYHELIPDILGRLDPTRLYWPSSPFATESDEDFNAESIGDKHNWQVWHGNIKPRKTGDPVVQDISKEGVSYKNYKTDFTRFSSEFGMHASANRFTLEKYIPEGEFYWKSVEMSYRNKDNFHEKGILLMEGFTDIPQTIDEYINYSMLTQAEGLKYGIEHYRRNKPFTSGALIWQHNDCWPGTSWSLIDYELLPKASFYYAKKFFAPVAATADHDPGKPVSISVINDYPDAIDDVLVATAETFSGEVIFSKELPYSVKGNQVEQLEEIEESVILQGHSAEEVFVSLQSKQNRFPENIIHLRDFKEMRYESTNLKVSKNSTEKSVTINGGDSFARFVKLDIQQEEVICSDNFFDLRAGEEKTVTFTALNGKEVDLEKIRIRALNSKSEGAEGQ
ncbi:beta-mannosidase [Jeotgalibacillus proteolyticus]|uniref:Beta-mannosidase B n=1 Tax=Jeotgalibacillus proteolyticus TaxID=2082395 RepID=A0A2S5G876_9BACL|nr:glycoside hydrolase family 2 protein [Jeotgalibacillus proteolyticus]PPA69143.1 beta-mannosidase [Jeotgalibacillus proteolyticus]